MPVLVVIGWIAVYGIAGGLIVHDAWKRRRWRSATLLVVAVLVSDCVLSVLGGYHWSMSGHRRYLGGLALMDQQEWQPRWLYLHWHPSSDGSLMWESDVGGFLAGPLILLDRACWHRTRSPVTSGSPRPSSGSAETPQ